MPKTTAPLELTEEQALYFRSRRGHLTGPGATDAPAAARAILGAQSQQLAPSLRALSMRMEGRPTASALTAELLEPPRRLVRTWGQRDTIHIYDAETDWAAVVAARGEWAPGGRGGPMPSEAVVDKARKLMASAERPVTRSDLIDVAPRAYVQAVEQRVGPGEAARRFAAGRLLWMLANQGNACAAGKTGAEQSYAARSAWFPELSWPRRPPPARAAATNLALRYLSAYGPATPTDIAHFFGARVANVRRWLESLDPGRRQSPLLPVRCGGRKGLLARAEDVDDLLVKPPTGARDWPVRLLPLWDCLLMGHADKRWTVPDPAEEKTVWRKAAHVCATVLARGRIVATWTQKVRGRRLLLEVQPLGLWRKSKHAAAVHREAKEFAAHLDLEDAEVLFRR
ncbi:MAG: crosslink repair DNA glycosylase YcaQ family protein [bacterium]